jgi:hypothetical protein
LRPKTRSADDVWTACPVERHRPHVERLDAGEGERAHVLWSPASYERLVGVWGLDSADATHAIEWLMAKVVAAIDDDGPLSA